MTIVLCLATLLALAACAHVAGRAACRLHLPDLVGFLLAGLAFGPTGLHLLDLHGPDPGTSAVLRVAADAGLVALMVTAGLAMPVRWPGAGWRRVPVFAGAILACLVPAYLTAPLVVGPLATDNAALAYRCALALAVVVTSVPFLTKILGGLGLLRTEFAATVLSVACVVDLVVWMLFPLLVELREGRLATEAGMIVRPAATLLMFGCVLALSRRVEPAKDAPGRTDVAVVVALALGTGAAAFAGLVGPMLAALAFGIGTARIAAGRKNGFAAARWSAPWAAISARLLVPIYFALVGAGLTLQRDLAPALILGFLLWSSAIKMGAVAIVAAGARLGAARSVAYALALNTRGGPGIALASLALGAAIIDGRTFVAFVFASVATSVMTDAGLRRLPGAFVADDRRNMAPSAVLDAAGAHV